MVVDDISAALIIFTLCLVFRFIFTTVTDTVAMVVCLADVVVVHVCLAALSVVGVCLVVFIRRVVATHERHATRRHTQQLRGPQSVVLHCGTNRRLRHTCLVFLKCDGRVAVLCRCVSVVLRVSVTVQRIVVCVLVVKLPEKFVVLLNQQRVFLLQRGVETFLWSRRETQMLHKDAVVSLVQ